MIFLHKNISISKSINDINKKLRIFVHYPIIYNHTKFHFDMLSSFEVEGKIRPKNIILRKTHLKMKKAISHYKQTVQGQNTSK